jgi:hypothetical protein
MCCRWALYRNAFVILSGMIAMDLLYELVDILNEDTVRYYFGRVLTFVSGARCVFGSVRVIWYTAHRVWRCG